MRLIRSWMAAVVGVAAAAGAANAAPELIRTAGSGTISNASIVSTVNGLQVRFTAASAGSMSVALELDAPYEVDFIEVECNRQSTAASQIQLTVRPKAGTAGKVLRIGSVRPISLDAIANAELHIASLATEALKPGQGNIGARGNGRGGEIRGHMISSVIAAGNITANIVAIGRLNPAATQSNVILVETRNGGSLLGDVRAELGTVTTVRTSGDIGVVPAAGVVQPQIVARDGIRFVQARNCWGSLDASRTGVMGNIQYLATSADFGGTLRAMNLAIIETIQPQTAIVVGGDMSGTMTFITGLQRTLTINGALSGTIDTGSVATDRPPHDPLRDTDVTIGSFPASGRFKVAAAIAGPITVLNGPIAGTIEQGTPTSNGSLYANITAPGLTGTIRMNGSVLAGRTIALSGPIGPTGLIHIGESLLGAITVPEGGIQGKVLVNAENLATPGSWSGSVTIGTHNTLAPLNGEHGLEPEALGGGVLALVPFPLHRTHSQPDHEASVPVLTSSFVGSSPILVRSYGPMGLGAGVGSWQEAVSVQREEPAGSCNWVDSEDAFTVTMPDDADARTLALYPSGVGLPVPGRYRVVATGLVNRGIVGEPAVRWPAACGAPQGSSGAYVFSMALDCDADGMIDTGDVLLPTIGYISDANGNGIPDACEQGGGGGPTTPPCPNDFNSNGTVDLSDLLDFFDAWSGGVQGTGNMNIDYDGSGEIDLSDLLDYFDDWSRAMGPCPA